MNNPFQRQRKALPINAVQEVGRDPLRPPLDTPPDRIVEVARKFADAKELLNAVLPLPETDHPTTTS